MTKILAIDDEEKILFIIKTALQKEGYEVTTVSNSDTLSQNDYLKYDLI
ncbi:MAG TPA: DNA-binding response regulator, partial [Clostridium sp.]|nr:DNA-binding response regulator [Clostridium sp.]